MFRSVVISFVPPFLGFRTRYAPRQRTDVSLCDRPEIYVGPGNPACSRLSGGSGGLFTRLPTCPPVLWVEFCFRSAAGDSPTPARCSAYPPALRNETKLSMVARRDAGCL